MRIFIGLIAALIAYTAVPMAHAADELVYIRMATNKGVIDLALNKTKAPITVANFLTYMDRGYYDGMVIHRIVPHVLIQGGGYNKYLFERTKEEPIQSEADNGLKNLRGTIAMARYEDPHTARSQFFINLQDNPNLDFRDKELMANWGYAVFGNVVSGIEVADAIGDLSIKVEDTFTEFPVEMVIVETVTKISAEQVGNK